MNEEVDRHKPCPICDKWVGTRGQHNHYMAHVRKGEMTIENDPLTALLLTTGILARHGEYVRAVARYIFRVVERS